MGKKKREVKRALKAAKKAGHTDADQQLMHEVWNEASGMTLNEAIDFIAFIEDKYNVRVR